MKSVKNFICLTIMIFMSASLMAKDIKITITGKDITIKQAFEQIEVQTKFSIAYNQTKFDVNRKLTATIKNLEIEKALTIILKNTGFTYKINGSHIIIKQMNESLPTGKPSDGKSVQTVRGIVTDAASGQPLSYATVALLNTNPLKGSSTDSLGRFHIDKVPIGRYDIAVSAVGYEPAVLREVLLFSAKESYNEVSLKERTMNLSEVVVRPNVNKEQPINQMALAGARMFSVEETNRFAGGFDDPARLATSFAGIAGNMASNSISVHGNSPQFLQWRLEGVEIPNPSHFADMTVLGGGIFTALSSQVMGNSDFFNGAFPAEYSNALSGVFDMSMRNGNNQKHEHTIQIGVLGVDIASEGPLSKNHNSSYIINYRYSTTGLLGGLVGGLNLKYQDLSFKLNFPTRKAGTFSIWGIGLADANNVKVEEDQSKWTSYADREDVKTDLMKAVAGINHKIYVAKDTYLKTSLSATYSENKQFVKMTEDNKTYEPVVDFKDRDWNLVFSTFLNKKFSSRHTNRTGVTVTGLLYDLDFNLSPTYVPITPMNKIVNGNASSVLISAYSNSVMNITDRLIANVGVTAQLFTLNNNSSVEPRVSLKYRVAPEHTLAVAYGLHSRLEKLDYYYVTTPATGDKLVNKDLSFSKANHFVLSYDWSITNNIHLKIEPYYQSLYNIPIEDGTSFSIINHDLYYLDRALVSKGKGRNYGVDFTLERYLNKGYYWLLTGSVFDSKYKGGDGIWRDTKYNRGYIVNGLIGKEWACGKQKQNVFSANIKLSYQGGDHYTPIDETASEAKHDIIFDETRAFTSQFPSVLTSDISVGYKINKKKTSHEFSLKILNAGLITGQHGYIYNEIKNTIDKIDVVAVIPNISYKIQF